MKAQAQNMNAPSAKKEMQFQFKWAHRFSFFRIGSFFAIYKSDAIWYRIF